MKAREHAIACLCEYMRRNFSGYNGRANRASFLRSVGLTDTELENLLSGEMLLDEPRFYKLLKVCCEYDYSGMRDKYPDWYIETPDWELIGFVERTLTLERLSGEEISGIQGIVKNNTVIIDDPELSIEEGDTLLHEYGAGSVEHLTIDEVNSYRYQTGKPAYVLKVRRCNAVKEEKIQHNNVNIYGIGNNAVVQSDSSITTEKSVDIEAIINLVIALVKTPFTWIKRMFS